MNENPLDYSRNWDYLIFLVEVMFPGAGEYSSVDESACPVGSTSIGFPITYGLGVMMKTSNPALQRLKQENEDIKVILSCMVNVKSVWDTGPVSKQQQKEVPVQVMIGTCVKQNCIRKPWK